MKKVTGTIAELVGRIAINGVVLNQVQLASLTVMGKGSICEIVGQKKSTGRAANVWEFDLSKTLRIELKE